MIREQYADFVRNFDYQKLRRVLSPRASILSSSEKKDDGEDAPPKGFEKFFRKKGERKAAAQSEGDAEKDKKGDEEKKADEGSEEDSKREEESDEKQKKKKAGEESFGERMKNIYFDPNGNPKPEMWMTLAAALACSFIAMTAEKPRKEIVFMQFLNDYLLKN
mmetsp:Transcript_46932/g.62106  ORF Transcript_46932/g.62106 Transcript_46932/m.62106 type:complete len:163 (-) Transcript_46932:2278-2766(-)